MRIEISLFNIKFIEKQDDFNSNFCLRNFVLKFLSEKLKAVLRKKEDLKDLKILKAKSIGFFCFEKKMLLYKTQDNK